VWSQLLALGAVVIYQLVLFYQYEQHFPVGKGIKALLRAAGIMTTSPLVVTGAVKSRPSERE
jgi:hypothetical protein